MKIDGITYIFRYQLFLCETGPFSPVIACLVSSMIFMKAGQQNAQQADVLDS